MATISQTSIATNNPLDICDGGAIPYFAIGAFDDALNGGATTNLLNTNPTILIWSFALDLSASYFIGVCGPAYAVAFNAEGEADSSQITLQVSEDQIQAGFVFGVNAGASAEIDVQEESFSWVSDGWDSHFATTWNDVLNLSADVEIDVIELMLYIGNQRSGGQTFINEVLHELPGLLGTWGFFDSQENMFAQSGDFQATPTFSITINLANEVPIFAALNYGLQKLHGDFSAGPQPGIGLPLISTPTQLQVFGNTYGNLQIQDGTITGTATATGGTDDGNLTVQLTHTPGLDFTVGFGFNADVAQVFNLGASVTLLTIPDPPITFDSQTHTLANTLGSTAAVPSGVRLVDVVFEPIV